MKTWLTVVEKGSFSGAGRALGMPLATVSRKVSELEAHLGTSLLRRTTRRLQLTDAGAEYLQACRHIIEAVHAAERLARGEYSAPKGLLRLTAPLAFGRLRLLPVIADFLHAYPDIDIRLQLSDQAVNLLENHVDIALRIGHLPDSSLVGVSLGATRYITCASPSYMQHAQPLQTPDDLSAHDCITYEGLATPSATRWQFRHGRKTRAIAVHSRLAVSTVEAALDACLAGIGITRVLEYQAAEHIASGALLRLLEAYEPAALPIRMLYARQSAMALKHKAFLDFMAPRLKAAIQHDQRQAMASKSL